MTLDLVRVAVEEEGAFGVLVKDGYPFVVTLEHTYGRGIKIPLGKTTCRRSRFYRGGYETFEVDVPGHSRILFHKGNVENDSDGCILVGARFGRLNGRAAILQSAVGFGEFMAAVEWLQQFTLDVRAAA